MSNRIESYYRNKKTKKKYKQNPERNKLRSGYKSENYCRLA